MRTGDVPADCSESKKRRKSDSSITKMRTCSRAAAVLEDVLPQYNLFVNPLSHGFESGDSWGQQVFKVVFYWKQADVLTLHSQLDSQKSRDDMRPWSQVTIWDTSGSSLILGLTAAPLTWNPPSPTEHLCRRWSTSIWSVSSSLPVFSSDTTRQASPVSLHSACHPSHCSASCIWSTSQFCLFHFQRDVFYCTHN